MSFIFLIEANILGSNPDATKKHYGVTIPLAAVREWDEDEAGFVSRVNEFCLPGKNIRPDAYYIPAQMLHAVFFSEDEEAAAVARQLVGELCAKERAKYLKKKPAN